MEYIYSHVTSLAQFCSTPQAGVYQYSNITGTISTKYHEPNPPNRTLPIIPSQQQPENNGKRHKRGAGSASLLHSVGLKPPHHHKADWREPAPIKDPLFFVVHGQCYCPEPAGVRCCSIEPPPNE